MERVKLKNVVAHLNLCAFSLLYLFITIPGKSSTPLRAATATLLTDLSYTEMDSEGEKGRRCCYCSTNACGHITEFIIWVSREHAC